MGNRKRKLPESPQEVKCVGPTYLCPYAQSTFRRKIPRILQKNFLECDAEGCLVYKIGDILLNRFEIISELGRGGSGVVLKVHDRKRKEHIALKVAKRGEAEHEEAVRECLMLEMVKGLDRRNERHLLQLLEAFCSDGVICLLFKQLGPDLATFREKNRQKGFALFEVYAIGKQLCEAVSFLHQKNFRHNDIKPSNIAFTDPSYHTKQSDELKPPLPNLDISVIDFGSMTKLNENRDVPITLAYRPPECIVGMQTTGAYDVWTIGCTLFELFIGSVLFSTNEDITHVAMIEELFGKLPVHMTTNKNMFKNGRIKFDRRLRLAREIKKTYKSLKHFGPQTRLDKEQEFFDLLGKMFATDPAKRITARGALRHKFFRWNFGDKKK